MLFTKIAAIAPLLLSSTTAHVIPRDTSSGSCVNVNYTLTEYQESVIDNYFALWSGNYSLLDQVVSPNLHFYQDRLPAPNGTRTVPINNTTELQAWIDHSRSGYSQLLIKKRYWIGVGYTIMVRWYLDGIIQNITDHAPGSKLPPGSPIVYNGTDTYFINPCTGLIDEVDSAQDFITYFSQLGISSIPV